MRRILEGLALVVGLAVAGGGLAQEQPISEPVWILRPSYGDYPPSPFPFSEYRGAVAVTCRVSGEALTECVPEAGASSSFGREAISAAQAARIGPLDRAGQRTNGRTITVSIVFPIPVATHPRPPPPAPVLTGVVWVAEPTSEDIRRYYPAPARQAGRTGSVSLDCLVATDGWLGCAVVGETPEGEGFGQAALRVSRSYQMASTTTEGAATMGGRVRVTIHFAPP